MRRIIYLLAIAAVIVSCGGPAKKLVKQAEPMMKEHFLGIMSFPETYEPVSTEYLGRGLIDKYSYNYGLDGPAGDSTIVRVFLHTFTHYNRSKDKIVDDRTAYFTDDMKLILTWHMGKPEEGSIRWIGE